MVISVIVLVIYTIKSFIMGNSAKETFFKILDTETRESFFIFDYLLYKQVDVVAIGSLLRPTLANVFLGHHEKEWLDNCPIHFKPIIYKK